MKNVMTFKKRPTAKVVPALTGIDLLHLDGHCLKGPRGRLGIALRPHSVAHLRNTNTSSPSHWLIPVEDVELVNAAASLPGEVLWLCARPPAEVLGQLHDDLRGAWLDAGVVVVNLDGHPRRLKLPEPPTPALALHYLARIVADRWSGTHRVAQRVAPPLPTAHRSQPRAAALCAA